jgi:DMSO/TMAO reductase YedYZ molybdopterin-dependent catalytic subunit
MGQRRQHVLAAATGVLAALATLAIAEVFALVLARAASPLVVVGSWVIDLVPPWVKETAIALFGTGDKVALLVCLGILVLILALGIGVLEYRRPPFGTIALSLVGLIALIAAGTRAGATWAWLAPTVLGTVGGVFVLRLAMRRLRKWVDAGPSSADAALSRRGFVAYAAAVAGASLIAGLTARAVNTATAVVNTVRQALTLPSPSTAAPEVASSADLGIKGVAPLFTPNAEFYRIDTALQVPIIRVEDWKLRIVGMVENEIEITFDELLALPLTETDVTIACVSNEIGGGLIGNARWLGYPLRSLLARAVPTGGADMVLSRSIDGFTASTPLSVLLDENTDSILAVGMNGEPLPLEHGFPVRMIVPGLYGYVSATKWVVELKLTRFEDETAYRTDRGWSERGPIKTSSRIDVPKEFSTVSAGKVAIAGVAWAQHRGIAGVEVRIDGLSWVDARLATAISDDTWVQWVYEWDARPGNHFIEVRATDSRGDLQSGEFKFVAPDGAEGWHGIDVTVF